MNDKVECRFECMLHFELDGKELTEHAKISYWSKLQDALAFIKNAKECGIQLCIDTTLWCLAPSRIEVRKVTTIYQSLDLDDPVYKEHSYWLDALNATMAYHTK